MRKIALIGSAPSSVRRAPYHDKNWEIWACSPGAVMIPPRIDRFFEMHAWRPENPCCEPTYVNKLKTLECPIYMVNPVPELPQSLPYPKQEVLSYSLGTVTDNKGRSRPAKFNPNDFGSTLSWMLAMAIIEISNDPEGGEIGLWGVDMAACTSPETRVLTSDLRWIECQELKVGDKIIAFDEEPVENGNSVKARRYRQAEVLEASRINKPCYRVELEDGTELVCSDDHKWLTYSENQAHWREAKDLVTPHHRADRPTRIVKLMDTWVHDKSWESGYLAGAFDGEGHLWQKLRDGDYGTLRCGFAQRDNEMLETVRIAMRDRGFDLAHTSTNGMNEDCLKHVIRGGRSKNLEFLGRVRPQRLLAKLNPEHIGKLQKQACVAVVKAEYIGEQAVIGLRTSTKTFIAEGFASHNTEEYGPQKDGCLALIHVAKSLGIRIALPPESDLIRPAPLYGYQEHTPLYVKLEERRKELAARIMDAAHRRQAAHDEFTFLTGAQDNVGYIMKTWVSDDQAIAMMYGQPDHLQIEHVIDASPVEAKPRKKGWPKGKKRTKPAKAAKAKKTVAQELVAAAEPKKRGWPKGKPRGPKLPSAVKLQAALA